MKFLLTRAQNLITFVIILFTVESAATGIWDKMKLLKSGDIGEDNKHNAGCRRNDISNIGVEICHSRQ